MNSFTSGGRIPTDTTTMCIPSVQIPRQDKSYNISRRTYPRLFLLLFFLLVHCITPASTYGQTVLKVGIYSNKPTIFVDKNGKVTGLFIDILEDIAGREGWELHYVNGNFSELLDKLKTGEIDLLPAIAFSKYREQVIDFNFTTVIANWAELYTPANSPITSLTELEGKKISVKQGDIHAKVLKKMTDRFNISCRFLETDEYETVFEMLHADVAEIGVVNRLFGKRTKADFNVDSTPIIFNPIEMRYAVPEGKHSAILGKIDSYLIEFKDSENSIYYQAINRWLVVNTQNKFPQWLRPLLYTVIGSAMFFLGAALLLQYQVQKRTKELRTSNRELKTQIEERKRAEEDLRKIARVVEASSDAMALLSIDHRHIITNSAYRSTIAGTSRDLNGISIHDLLDRTYFENELRGPIEKCLAGEIIQLQTLPQESPTDNRCWNVTLSPYLTPEGEIDGYVLDIRDVTLQNELANRLKNAQKMEAIGMLAGGVAHDLNNILSGIVSYPDMLLINRPPEDPITKPLQTIKRSGERAAAIVQDLLTLARKGIGEAVPVNLNNVITEFLDSPEHRELVSNAEHITFKIALETNLFNIAGSPVHLLKIFMNLFLNALEAMEQEGLLQIYTENKIVPEDYPGYEIIPAGEYITLSITDTGIGMSMEEMNHLFEPFYSRKIMGRSGTGLGMSVVWGSMKDHQGYIDIRSKPGSGTTFTLYFPVISDDLQEKENIEWYSFRGQGQHILVVDDMKDQRALATEILTLLGYVVHVARSGEEAVEQCKDTGFDLLLLDMIMPGGIDGLETYSRICEFHPRQKTVIASGYSESNSVQKAQELGAGTYIKKPYTVTSLARAVYQELTPKPLQTELAIS